MKKSKNSTIKQQESNKVLYRFHFGEYQLQKT